MRNPFDLPGAAAGAAGLLVFMAVATAAAQDAQGQQQSPQPAASPPQATSPSGSPPAARQPPQQTTLFADAYRGAIVCEPAISGVGILNAPFDLVVRGHAIQFARPIFNLRGSRVVGNELGIGVVDANGAVRLEAQWDYGRDVRAEYEGSLTAKGGVLTGTQSWRGPDGAAKSRTCQIAVVPSANAEPPTD